MLPNSNNKLINIPINLKRYYANYQLEATAKDQAILESMLGIMAIISRQRFQTQDNRYCRAIAWIETSNGENHLVTTASIRGEGSKLHAEELLARALYRFYKNDPKVVKDGVIHIKKGFVDIEPCDGKRYGKNHHCRQLFSQAGQPLKIDNKRIQISFNVHDSFYWYAPTPATDNSSRARTDDAEDESSRLGFDFNKTHEHFNTWDKCFVIDSETKIEEKKLSDVFAAQSKEDEISDSMRTIYKTLAKLIYTNKADEYFSKTTIETLSELLADEEDEHKTFWLAVKGVDRQSSLRVLIKNPLLSKQVINAIKEVQIFKDVILEKKNQLIDTPAQLNLLETLQDEQIFGEVFLEEDQPKEVLPQTPVLPMQQEEQLTEALFAKEDEPREVEVTTQPSILPPLQDAQIPEKLLLEKKDQPSNISAQTPMMLMSKPQIKLSKQFDLLCQSDNIRAFKNFLKKLKETPHYNSTLLNKTANGFTPLMSIMRNGSAQILRLYLQELKNCIPDTITLDDYFNLLISPNNDEFSPLHSALIAAGTEAYILDSEKLLIYLVEFEQFIKRNDGYRERYIRLLTTPTNDGFTPLHSALKAGNTENAALYFDALNKVLDKDSYIKLLTYPNKEGFTPLHDALKAGKTENAVLYFATLDKMLDKDSYIKLLTHPNKEGFTPLHDALIAGNTENVVLYFVALDKVLDKDSYIKLLTYPNKEGFTPLHEALIAGNTENARLYFNAIKNVLDNDTYVELLTQNTKEDFTPLHDVLIAGNTENVRLYFDAVKNLDNDSYVKLLTSQNKENFTPLHQALKAGNTENARLYFDAIKNLDNDSYVKLLTSQNKENFTPLHQALKAGNTESARLYFDAVKNLDNDNYVKLLTNPTKEGFTPLHDALKAGNTENARLYFDAINNKLDNATYVKLLTHQNKDGFTPLHQVLKAGNTENARLYFVALDKVLDKDSYIKLLTHSNTEGFTPLHHALISGNTEITALYFEHLLKLTQHLPGNKRQKILRHRNIKGFNILHQAAMTGEITVIEAAVKFIHDFCNEKAIDIIKDLLNEKTTFGYYPSCPNSHVNSKEINAYLSRLHKNPKAHQAHPHFSDYKKSSDNKTRNTKDKIKDKMEIDDGSAVSERKEISVDRKRKDLSDNAQPNVIEQHKRVAVNCMFKPVEKVKINESKIIPLATGNPVANNSEFTFQSEGKRIKLITTACSDNHPHFRTYACQNDEGKKAFVIELKEYNANKLYNFADFRPDIKVTNAELILHFTLPPGSVLKLPNHLCCMLPAQPPDVKIYGKYQLINSIGPQNDERFNRDQVGHHSSHS